MTTHTLTDEDGQTAQYTITPNFGGLTMTVTTEGVNGEFDAEALTDALLVKVLSKEARAQNRGGMVMTYDDAVSLVEAAFAAGQASRVPDGWQLVPIKPTQAMEAAGKPWAGVSDLSARKTYAAMLSASPKAGE